MRLEDLREALLPGDVYPRLPVARSRECGLDHESSSPCRSSSGDVLLGGEGHTGPHLDPARVREVAEDVVSPRDQDPHPHSGRDRLVDVLRRYRQTMLDIEVADAALVVPLALGGERTATVGAGAEQAVDLEIPDRGAGGVARDAAVERREPDRRSGLAGLDLPLLHAAARSDEHEEQECGNTKEGRVPPVHHLIHGFVHLPLELT